MKSALSLTLIVCLVGSTVPVTAQSRIDPTSGPMARAAARDAARRAAHSRGDFQSQAQDRLEHRGIGIFVTMEPQGDCAENECRGVRDSAKALRTRLEERVDKEIATIVSDPAQADLTIVVTGRGILFETNTVHARLTVGDFSLQFTGRSDGMWGPAATDLAKNISVWLSASALQLRASIQEGVPLTAVRLIDPRRDLVQRAAVTLGVGKTVEVTTTGSEKLRAKIQSIDASGFTVTHGTPPVPLTIAYDEVTELKPAGWPTGAKITLAGAVVGASIILMLRVVAYFGGI